MKTVLVVLGIAAVAVLSAVLVVNRLDHPQNPYDPPSNSVVLPMAIEDVPSDTPEQRRKYSVRLKSRSELVMSVEFRYSDILDERRVNLAEIEQPNERGKSILFDPENPADKIIDPVILPEVKALSAQILEMDRVWWDSHPDTFVDKKGRTWRLENSK